ncbi:MAG: type II/IV secretion system protein [Candidatus Levybacteria bacterium]|nr:type II/IV secretion system protein [Candidatus Levybacteria bacterium]
MPAYTDQSLYDALTELAVIDKTQLDAAFETSKKQRVSLSSLLADKDLLSDENLGRTIAEITGFPLVRLRDISVAHDILSIIPEVVAKTQKMLVFKKDKRGLHVAMADPTNLQMRNFLAKKTGLPIIAYIATTRDINDAMRLFAKDITTTFSELIEQNAKKVNVSAAKETDLPIIKIVDTIMSYAYQNRASDIHIEPLRKETLIRFRIDGILHDILTLPLSFHQPIATRIKVLADLRTDEHQAAQDGKLQFQAEDEDVDVRVSFVPTITGEKIVMRLLSERSRQFSLADLGFGQNDLSQVKKAYEKPYGMLLATGPTGSGKTTTIYAILKLINKRDVNIMTIEDPVEYEITGVNHIQVNPKTNLTFAEGLRSIVRQDPNIILVGEIRDSQTADIAINSAMTGHLVLSTLHTNDATTALPRLLDMGIEPFLVASTVNVIIAQRLVRKIHTSCRVSEVVNTSDLTKQLEPKTVVKIFGESKSTRLYRGKGCTLDHQTGYDGRVGIFEVLVVNDEVRKGILERKDASSILAIAVKRGMTTMLEDGLEKVKQGITTIDEIVRVTKEQ